MTLDSELHELHAQSAEDALPKLAERAARARARAAQVRVKAGAAVNAAERAAHERSARVHEQAVTCHDAAAMLQQTHRDHERDLAARKAEA